ncbi:ABC transporter permease [Ruminococcus sp.]|uniref:ABC transporter permease n=1 Tax=Ruminococcus sp. TaxID=41978 RepID=UPI002600639A|nr:ABC transporter permease [Ruminococcus sp.]MBQ8965776.1 ABC transporter permease [Ruminococcus sp.]
MNFVESIKMAFTSLTINKMRSFLTMLGIIIGISAVITITTIGNSISSTLQNTFSEIGSVKLSIYPDVHRDYSGEWHDLPSNLELTLSQVQELINLHPDELTYSCSDVYGRVETANVNGDPIQASMYGVSDDFMDSIKKQLTTGRVITKKDLANAKNTCLVSDYFCEQYFGTTENVIGKTIKFNTLKGLNKGCNISLTIVGIFELTELDKNDLSINKVHNDQEKMQVVTYIFFPYNTMLKEEGLTPEETKLPQAEIGWTAKCDKETAKGYINDYFEKIYKGEEQWYMSIYDEEEIVGRINTVLNVITIAISVIAAISLIVGGVGVMNIMLVSILERTREIGVRKALGALNGDIRSQFVIEAIIICLTGGTIGVILGIVNGVLISKVASYLLNTLASEFAEYITLTVQPSVPAILISLGFSMLTGLIFGYYPAKRAGNMDPIDALRYE